MSARNVAHYRLLSRLGAGGMGEVYKAEDTKLERDVAVKLLPPEATRDPDRLQRFKQEAKATSALNHPNITTIHEVGVHEGQHFITVEFIDGTTLRHKMREKLEIPQVLDIAVQVAEGLNAAHTAGVVHRDLKPDNIMVRHDGITKILDFGLAKLKANGPPAAPPGNDADETIVQPAQSPGDSSSLTQPGVVMGTVAYMSPEQARGEEVDHRSDIFSFGSILYELTSGEQPFRADSSIEVMHKILRQPPKPPHESNADIPAELSRIIRKSMAKDPEERYQSAKDLAIDLKALKRELDSGSVSAGWPAVASDTVAATPRSRAPLAIAAVVVALAVAGLVWMTTRRAPTPVADLEITRLTTSGNAGAPALSPDGKFVAYVESNEGERAIWMHQLATGTDAELVPSSAEPLSYLRFSPDGNWLFYCMLSMEKRRFDLWRVSTLGGPSRRVLETLDSAPSFSPDGQRFVFARQLGMNDVRFYVVAADGTGEPDEVGTTPENALAIIHPRWSPDGESIAYVQYVKENVLYPQIRLLALHDGSSRVVQGPNWMLLSGLTWAPDGSGLYVSGSRSWMERTQIWFLDTSSGSGHRLTKDLATYTGPTLQRDGSALAAVRTDFSSNFWHVPMTGDPESNTREARRITRGTDIKSAPQVSPDGTQIVFGSDASGALDLWIMDVDGRNQRQLTFDDHQDFSPLWSPDGQTIAYASERDGDLQIWVIDVNGGSPRQVTPPGGLNFSHAWSPDSQSLSYLTLQGDRAFICTIAAAGGAPVQVSETRANMVTTWSPDGNWIASWEHPENPGAPARIVLHPARGDGDVRFLDYSCDTARDLRAMLSLTWMPAGDSLALFRRHAGKWNVETVALNGGEVTPRTAFTDDEVMFAFGVSPDASFAIVQRGVVTNDVVLLKNIR